MTWSLLASLSGVVFFSIATALVIARVITVTLRLTEKHDLEDRIRATLHPFLNFLEIGRDSQMERRRRQH